MTWDPIDGETPIDPSRLRDKSIRNRKQLNDADAEEIRQVVVKYLAATPSPKLAPFDYAWIVGLHKEMFGRIWEFGGEPRAVNLNLGVEWTQVQTQLMQLVGDLEFWSQESDMPLIDQAARLHYHAVHIHPFENGNGRWARMLADIWLRRNGSAPIRWPADVAVESSIRAEYLEALQHVDQGNWDPFLELHRRLSDS